MKLSINCLVLGDSNTFTVYIPEKYTNSSIEIEYSALTVSAFTKIIKNQVEHAALDSGDPDSMRLWRVDIDDESLKNISTEKDIENKFNGKMMKCAYPFSDYFPTAPILRNIHVIIVPTTATPNKKIKLEDRTDEFLRELLPPFDEDISFDNVAQLLSEPLLCKLPCLPVFITSCSDVLEDLNSYDTYPARLCAVVLNVMSKNFKQASGGEAITSGNIDVHIKNMIELAQEFGDSCSNFDLDRNKGIKSSSTATENSRDRPDMTVYYEKVLIMMGEEKDLDSKLEDAENQLDGYFDYWNTLAFGKLPFVMAYAAAGTKLQFYYYHPDNKNKPVRVKIGDLINLGTANKRNNYKALQYIINFIRIIKTWRKNGCLVEPKIKLYQVITRENETTITITPKKVIKKIHIENRELAYKGFFEDFYTRIFPNLGKYMILRSKFYKKWIHLEFAPVGYMTIPENENELREAIWDVLNVVKMLHANGVVHRDIRWENIIRLTNDGWILIDFEEAAPIGRGNRRTPTLNITAPEYRGREDSCQVTGDIWMIGNLLNDSRIRIQLSESARNFRDKLMQLNPGERPTAENAIDDDWFKDM